MEDENNSTPVSFVEEKDVLGQPKKQLKIIERSEPSQNGNMGVFTFASFSDRMIAATIDIIICYIAVEILNTSLFADFHDGVFITLVNLLYNTIYFASFESSKWQATPGKKFINLKVVQLNGEPISFMRGIGRYWGKTISTSIFFLGIISILRDEQKQAWHDMFAGTLVIKDK